MPLNSPAEHIPGFEYRATAVLTIWRDPGPPSRRQAALKPLYRGRSKRPVRAWTISSTRLSKRFELPSLIDFQRIVVHAIVHASNRREKVCAGLRGAEVEYHIDADSSAV
jgi:hypothetical protein